MPGFGNLITTRTRLVYVIYFLVIYDVVHIYLTDFISGYKNARFSFSSELYQEFLSMPYQEKVCSLTRESLNDAYNIRYPSSVIQIAWSSPSISSAKKIVIGKITFVYRKVTLRLQDMQIERSNAELDLVNLLR